MTIKNARTANRYDVIVIGSGMGGLTVASLLAQIAKKRVLILESHFKPGGFTHSFRRNGYEWDVGVHYVGNMTPGGLARRVMDKVTGQGVDWYQMPSPYERMVFPDSHFDYPAGEGNLCDALVRRFPREERNILAYFRDVRATQSWFGRWFAAKQFPQLIGKCLTWRGRRLAEMLTVEYMDRFDDPQLVAILLGQWPDYGTPPHQSAFGFHSVVTADYFDGGFFPVGGAKEIASAAIKQVKSFGGDCLVNHPVENILVRNGTACGVTCRNKGKELQFDAPIIVSNAGATATFEDLVPQGECDSEREKLSRIEWGPSANILFMGLKDDPRKVGFQDVNYWFFSDYRHDWGKNPRSLKSDDPTGVFLSFGSLRNPSCSQHTAQLISFSRLSEWDQFSESNWKRRDASYEERKSRVGENLLNFVCQHMPELRSLVDYVEVSTPLTVRHFSGHKRGTIYGQLCDRSRLAENSWPITTSIRGLYLTGSDVGTPGVNGALMAGAMTTGKLLGMMGMPRLLASLSR